MLFISDIHQSWLHPQVRIRNNVVPLNRTLKIMGVTLSVHFTFGPHARDCVKRAARALGVIKPLAGSRWIFTTENLVAICTSGPHLKSRRPHLVHSDVLFPPEQNLVDPELRSEDRDWLPSKGQGVQPQSRDWGPPLEGAPRTVHTAVLC